MSEQRTSIEIIAPTVEEAVERGAAELGLPRSALEVEILDEGGKGLFGLGTRQARVRLSLRAGPAREGEPASRPVLANVAAPSEAEEADDALRVTREIVLELLERMGVEARVGATSRARDGPLGEIPPLLYIHS